LGQTKKFGKILKMAQIINKVPSPSGAFLRGGAEGTAFIIVI